MGVRMGGGSSRGSRTETCRCRASRRRPEIVRGWRAPVNGEELSVLAEERAALRRVPTLVARGVPTSTLHPQFMTIGAVWA